MVKRIRRTKSVASADGSEVTDEVEETRTAWFSIESISSYAAIGGIVFGLVTALLAIASYHAQSDKDIDSRIFAAKKPFFDKQMEVYADAIDTVSRIATATSPDAKDVDHFWQIYWGRMAAVESTKVDQVMVKFGNMIGRDGKKSVSPRELQNASLLLAHCIKQHWSETWGVPLEPAPEMPCTDRSIASISGSIADMPSH